MASIQINSWTPSQKGARLGFLDVTSPRTGLRISGITVFDKNGSRWCKLPHRRWKTRDGEWNEEPVVQFDDRDKKDAFDQVVLAELDRHTREGGQ